MLHKSSSDLLPHTRLNQLNALLGSLVDGGTTRRWLGSTAPSSAEAPPSSLRGKSAADSWVGAAECREAIRVLELVQAVLSAFTPWRTPLGPSPVGFHTMEDCECDHLLHCSVLSVVAPWRTVLIQDGAALPGKPVGLGPHNRVNLKPLQPRTQGPTAAQYHLAAGMPWKQTQPG